MTTGALQSKSPGVQEGLDDPQADTDAKPNVEPRADINGACVTEAFRNGQHDTGHRPVHLSADQRTFETLEDAILRTPLGRWFLREVERRARTTETRNILDAIGSVRAAVEAQRSTMRLEVVREELKEMAATIDKTREEISAIRPDGAGNSRIFAATEELDAIVTATERATSDILEAAEKIHQYAVDLRAAGVDPDLCDTLDAEVVNIFTACTFQDITGQRTTKVVNVLRYLETRVKSMIEIWGVDEETAEAVSLTSGPQLDGLGVSQADVDAMMKQGAGQGGELDIDALFNDD